MTREEGKQYPVCQTCGGDPQRHDAACDGPQKSPLVCEHVARLRYLIGETSPLNAEGRAAVRFALRTLEYGLLNAKYTTPRVPLWANVRDAFGYGSTSSMQLCEAFGLNPHAQWKPEDD